MANRITSSTGNPDNDLKLSNGAMSVVVSSLCLSGSRLAADDYEIDLVSWLASRDQSVLGIGTVGFDLSEMPWRKNQEIFENQKKFILQAINAVANRTDLHHLDYEPPLIEGYMITLENLVREFNFNNVSHEKPSWYLSPHEEHAKCELHGVYLHEYGCVVCNDK